MKIRAGAVACLLVVGCGDNGGGPHDAAIDAAPDAYVDPYVDYRFSVTANRDVDILWVINDSNSMLEKQTSLKNGFQAFITQLAGIEGGPPNLHIGVVTSDLGTQGSEDASPGPGIGSGPGSCSGTGKQGTLQTNGSTLVQGPFISDIKNTDGTRNENYIGSLKDAFASIASVGAAGCAFEQPMQAARVALDNNSSNTGFRRQGAHLAVIFFGDEDDCSFTHSTLIDANDTTLGPLASFRCTHYGVTCDVGGTTPDEMNTPGVKSGCHSNEASPYLTRVADHEAFLKTLDADAYVAAIVAPPTPFEVALLTPPGGTTAVPRLLSSCTPTVADPGVRTAQLAETFARHRVEPICPTDLASALTNIGHDLRELVQDTCLLGELHQPLDCTVTEESAGTVTPIPACDATASVKPCWGTRVDPVSCQLGNHIQGIVERSAAPPPDTVVHFHCLR